MHLNILYFHIMFDYILQFVHSIDKFCVFIISEYFVLFIHLVMSIVLYQYFVQVYLNIFTGHLSSNQA